MQPEDYNSQNMPLLGSDVYALGQQDALDTISVAKKEEPTPSAVITSTPVVEKAQDDIKTLESVKTTQTPQIVKAMEEMVADGKGRFVDGKFINLKGDIYDLNGNIIGKEETPTTDSSAVVSALGGTTLQPGQVEKTAPDGSKYVVGEDGIITQGTGKYQAGTRESDYSELSGVAQQTSEIQNEYNDIQNKLSDLSNNADERLKARIVNIEQMIESAVKSQEEANKAAEGITNIIGMTSGRSRYAPDIQLGILKNQIDSGLSKITDLKLKGAQLIMEAEEARDERQFKILSEKMRAYQENRKQMFDETIKTQQLALDLEKWAEESKKVSLETAKLAREESYNTALEYVPSMLEMMEGMSLEEQNEFINNTAKGSGAFDAITLKSAIDTYQRQVQAEMTKGISSEMADWRALGGLEGTGKTFDQFFKDRQIAKNVGSTTPFVSFSQVPQTTQNKAMINAFYQASLGLPKHQKEDFGSRMSELLSLNTLEDDAEAVSYLVRAAYAGAGIEEQKQAIGRAQATRVLSDIGSMILELNEAGVDTNLLTGTVEQVMSKLGTTTDPRLAYISNRIDAQLQIYRRSMTGVAFGEEEAAEYAKIFPRIKDVATLNVTKIRALLDNFDEQNRASLSFYIGSSNYDTIFSPQTKTLGSQVSGGSAPAPASFSATAGGKTYYFNSQAELDSFKKDAGIK